MDDGEEASESEEDELAEDSERGDADEEEDASPTNNNVKDYEWIPLNCFKDLYGVSPIYKLM